MNNRNKNRIERAVKKARHSRNLNHHLNILKEMQDNINHGGDLDDTEKAWLNITFGV